MIKLFKTVDGDLNYWEAWDADNKRGVIHWGKVGEAGKNKELTSGFFSNFKSKMKEEIEQKIREGYIEFDQDKFSLLEIEFKIDGFGTDRDLDKQHRLEERMNQTLGWTGLGHTDGGSIGSGTMEVGCIVVDFGIAKKVIEKDLEDTEFCDYSRIF